MSTKADYLKRYLNAEDSKTEKKKKRVKKRANLAIHDDDVDWRSLVPEHQEETDEEEDPEEAPQVAEFKDDTLTKVVRWQPVDSGKQDADVGLKRRSRKKRKISPDLSPPRVRQRPDSDNDLSPPRRKHSANTRGPNKKSSTRHTSPQIIEHGVISASHDLSPPRTENSPQRRTRHSSPHISPPRRNRHDSSDNSPPRRVRHDSPDISPPRRTNATNSKKRHDSPDISPPRRTNSSISKKRHDSPDISPPRRKRHNSTDLSPPRKNSDRPKSEPRKRLEASNDENRMSSGAKAGLQSAQALKEENALVRRRQDNFFKTLDPSVSGRHAETVYRDKQGKKVDPKLEKLKQREKEREMEEENEKFMTWGRGTAQAQSYQEKLQDDLYEMSKPLARYADDEDLERMLKARERAGDPMLAFLKKPSSKTNSNRKPKKERPTYKGAFPPNRYGIKPGYRWDGVNRSNGFEKTWFSKEANKKATAEEAYKWSVEDM